MAVTFETARTWLRAHRWRVAIIVGCLVPVVVQAFQIQRHWVNVPVHDDWALTHQIQLMRTGRLGLDDLWTQHNEHRLVFPRIVMLALARTTHWDVRYEMVASFCFASASLAVVLLLARRTLRGVPVGAVAVASVSTSVLMFSPVQWENWLWGWQVQWFMTVFCCLAAVGVLHLWPERRPPGLALAPAVVLALVGHYSLASGVFIWVIAVPLFLVQERYRRWLPLWVIAGGLSTFAYLRGYHKPGSHPPTSTFFKDPVEGSEYVALYLGRPLFDSQGLGVGAGYVLLILFLALCVYFCRQGVEAVRRIAPWFAIGMYAVFSAGSTAVGRVGSGVEQAGSSRYTTVSLLLTLAVMMMAVLALAGLEPPDLARPRQLLVALSVPGVAVIGLQVTHYPNDLDEMAISKSDRVLAHECLERVSRPQARCLRKVYFPGGEYIWPDVRYLRSIGWIPGPAAQDTP